MRTQTTNTGDEIIIRSGDTIDHYLYFKNYSGTADRLKARITVWDQNRVAPAAIKGQIEATFYRGQEERRVPSDRCRGAGLFFVSVRLLTPGRTMTAEARSHLSSV